MSIDSPKRRLGELYSRLCQLIVLRGSTCSLLSQRDSLTRLRCGFFGLNGQEKSFKYSRERVSVHYVNIFMLNFEIKVSQRYFIWPVLCIWGVPYRWLKKSRGLVPYLWDATEVQYCPLKSLSEQYCPLIFSSNWPFDQYSPQNESPAYQYILPINSLAAQYRPEDWATFCWTESPFRWTVWVIGTVLLISKVQAKWSTAWRL